jgi:hypothetical protein
MRFAIVLLLVACGTPEPAAVAPPPSPECLAKVDKADGAEDHVGHKCPNCGLGMEGQAAHASAVGLYELHSCSAECKAKLDADPAAVLARACAK